MNTETTENLDMFDGAIAPETVRYVAVLAEMWFERGDPKFKQMVEHICCLFLCEQSVARYFPRHASIPEAAETLIRLCGVETFASRKLSVILALHRMTGLGVQQSKLAVEAAFELLCQEEAIDGLPPESVG